MTNIWPASAAISPFMLWLCLFVSGLLTEKYCLFSTHIQKVKPCIKHHILLCEKNSLSTISREVFHKACGVAKILVNSVNFLSVE